MNRETGLPDESIQTVWHVRCLSCNASFVLRNNQAIAKTALGLDAINTNLAAQAADEHFDRVRIPVKVLIINMLDQFCARYDPTLMMHQVGQHAIFMRCQLDRVSTISLPASSVAAECPAARRRSARRRASNSSVTNGLAK